MQGLADASAPPMRMEAFKPSPALAACVTDLWDYAIPRATRIGLPPSLTLLPDGCPTMVFVFGAALRATDGERVFTTRSAVCGFQMQPVQVSCDGDVAGITVRFTPAGLSCLMPGSLEAAALQRLECRDVFGRRAIEELESALAELPTALARIRRVEAYLLTLLRAKADPLVEHAVGHLAGAEAGLQRAHARTTLSAGDRLQSEGLLAGGAAAAGPSVETVAGPRLVGTRHRRRLLRPGPSDPRCSDAVRDHARGADGDTGRVDGRPVSAAIADHGPCVDYFSLNRAGASPFDHTHLLNGAQRSAVQDWVLPVRSGS